ncbi:MAG: phosphoribosylamine--glycine ligase [Candidatus Riflebacteria bacterium]|nr:phosphoribosylamine--glycine ligase [Candidatus Riflebacteria bacterium]
MKVALIGSGGREAAIAWKLAKDIPPENVFVLPGNDGIANARKISSTDFEAIDQFLDTEKIDLTFIGPEKPLEMGIVDFLSSRKKRVLGPDKQASLLESSKCFAKRFMKKYGVASADFKEFNSSQDAYYHVSGSKNPMVIKFDGLAAGKGVFVCKNGEEAIDSIEKIEKGFGPDSGIVVEEMLYGREVSIIGFTDGKTFRIIRTSQDHKRLLNNDMGPNTGGMGAYTPVPFCDSNVLAKIEKEIISPTIEGIIAEKLYYCGPLYFGVMLTADGPKLLEYNARMGDPESQVLMPSLKTSLIEIADACLNGTLDQIKIETYNSCFLGVVLASKGYPDRKSPEAEITGLDKIHENDALIFHSATKKIENRFYAHGGRILTVVGKGNTIEKAAEMAYKAAEKVSFDGVHFRRDIGSQSFS